jgi:hypothetical protein
LVKARAARAAQPKPPAWRDNPAGNAAVKFANYARFVQKLHNKMKTFPFGTKELPIPEEFGPDLVRDLTEMSAALADLAATGYKPVRTKGRGFTIQPGMRVFLKPEGLEVIGKQLKLKGTEEFFVSDSCDPSTKTPPVRIGGAGNAHTFVGFVPRNMLSSRDLTA